jgi:hypothetical protein
MKKLMIALICFTIGISSQLIAQQKVDGPQFKFEGGDTHDYGIIPRGPVAFHTFEFTNTGTRPLNVMNVTPSCGCTGVEWIKTPVMPGQKGWIKLGLKTEEQKGVFNKEVYIQSDAITPHGEKRYTLYIKGDARDDVKKPNDK